jgi:hypothetical protein
MDFGIAFPSFIRSWQDVALAEQYGFTHACGRRQLHFPTGDK